MSPIDDTYYSYRQLPPNHIRLLSIHQSPGDDRESMIELSMEEFSLDQLPTFNALSYTWGPPTFASLKERPVFVQEPRCYPFVCDGKLLLGTHNLRDALYHIRYGQKPQAAEYVHRLSKMDMKLFIWIDALCINQEDLEERANQVAIMAQIYQGADRVMAWLGSEDGHSRNALRMCVELCNMYRKGPPAASEYHADSTESKHLFSQSLRSSKFSSQEWLDYSLFMRRSWFSRSWILQEVASSKSLLLMCGTLIIDWDVLADATRYLIERGWTQQLVAIALKYVLAVVGEGSDFEFYAGQVISDYSRIGCMDGLRANREHGPYTNLYMTHLMMISSICSDPRDKVYAQLSMNDDLKTIRPDYTVEAHNLYADAWAAALVKEGNLRLLHTYQSPQRISRLQGLPTWCIDLSQRRVDSLLHMPGDPCPWQADLGLPQPATNIEIVAGTLRVHALRLASIAESLKLDGGAYNDPWDHAKVLNMVSKLRQSDSSCKQSKFETLWRTLIAGCLPAGQIAGSEISIGARLFYEGYQTVLKSNDSDDIEIGLEPLESLLSAFEEFSRAEIGDHSDLPVRRKFKRFLHEQRDVVRSKETYKLSATLDTKKDLLVALKVSDGDAASANHWYTRYMYVKRDKSLFRTDDGHLGLASDVQQIGDEVWLLKGLDTPCVLRPMPNGRYQFLGDAYVHGIMCGEAVPEGLVSTTRIDIE